MNGVLAHPQIVTAAEVMIAYWAFSAFVSGMPAPPPGAFWYAWLYSTLHMFAGNLRQFADSKIQSLETTVTTKTTSVDPTKEP